MTEVSGPREVFGQLLDAITGERWSELAGFYAENAVVELPFAIPEPVRYIGREALREHFVAGAPFTLRVNNVVVHETADPEMIIAEWDFVVNGQSQLANVQILRARDGKIVSTRDFHNHRALAELWAAG